MNLEIRPHVRHSNPAPMFADAVGLPQLLLRRDAAGTSLMTRVSHAKRPNCAGAAALLSGSSATVPERAVSAGVPDCG